MDTTDYNMIGPSCYYLYYGVNAMVREESEGMEYELWLYASEYRRLLSFG